MYIILGLDSILSRPMYTNPSRRKQICYKYMFHIDCIRFFLKNEIKLVIKIYPVYILTINFIIQMYVESLFYVVKNQFFKGTTIIYVSGTYIQGVKMIRGDS